MDAYLYYLSIPILLIITFLFIRYRSIIVTPDRLRVNRFSSKALGLVFILLYVLAVPMYLTQGRGYHLLLTDLCPFASLTFGFALLWGRERFIKMMMPWLLLGSILTILVASPDMANEGVFSGLLSYMRHTLMFISFFWALINLKTKYDKWDLLNTYLYVTVFMVWVILAAGVPYWVSGDKKWGVFSTGLLKPSWEKATLSYRGGIEKVGDYAFFAELGMPYPVTTILFYGLSCVVVFGLVWFVNWYLLRVLDDEEDQVIIIDAS